MRTTITKEWLEQRIERIPWSGCWIWMKTTKGGRGRIMIDGKYHYVYRVVYELYNEGLIHPVVRHSCDVPCCVCPHHLIQGSHLENSKDAVLRGQQARGERSGMAKLTDPEILEIRRLYGLGNFTQKELAIQYHVDQSLISYIVNNKIWSHL